MGKLGILLVVGIAIFAGWIWYGPLGDKEVPNIPDFYWGSSQTKNVKEDTSIRPFKINISDSVLSDLKTRLGYEITANRLTPPLEGIHFQYGFNTLTLNKIISYWHAKYDWKSREAKLNAYPQFLTNIAGIDIHFQHVKSDKKTYKNTKPLLLLHGWPGSFVDFQKIIPGLINPANSETNFELIIPSLPGYGFSERGHRPGLGHVEMAQIFHKLMTRLGYNEFYIQGGDWGSAIATNMANLYPNNVKGLHMNGCMSQHPRTTLKLLLASIYPTLVMKSEETSRLFPLSNLFSFIMQESGYFHIQATKPDTIGAALVNSPSGLAAYILEKFSTWTNRQWLEVEDGGILKHYNLDELLDNVMVYWVTKSITSSMRLYSEAFTKSETAYGLPAVPVKVPTACLNLPNDDLSGQTEFFLRDKYHNLVSYTRGTQGGHFPAFEVPQIFTTDVIKFFSSLESKKPDKST